MTLSKGQRDALDVLLQAKGSVYGANRRSADGYVNTNAAISLCTKGLARMIKRGGWAGYTFVATDAARKLREEGAL